MQGTYELTALVCHVIDEDESDAAPGGTSASSMPAGAAAGIISGFTTGAAGAAGAAAAAAAAAAATAYQVRGVVDHSTALRFGCAATSRTDAPLLT